MLALDGETQDEATEKPAWLACRTVAVAARTAVISLSVDEERTDPAACQAPGGFPALPTEQESAL